MRRASCFGFSLALWFCATVCSAVTGCTERDSRLSTTSSNRRAVSAASASAVPAAPAPRPLPASARVAHAIIVSVDGLAARYLEQLVHGGLAPNFARLQTLSAWTHNARTDKTYTNTLPNHTCMLTGLPVSPVAGLGQAHYHGYTSNTDPDSDETLHKFGGPGTGYTPSIFDVAHDNGATTALFASKTKFSLYEQSYNAAGAPDTTGPDNGRRKVDTFVIDTDPVALVDKFVALLKTNPPALSFVHLNQPDGAGHSSGWGSKPYLAKVVLMDEQLGKILDTVQLEPLIHHTALIVTSDHGGTDTSHLESDDAQNFTIPFYALAPGLKPGDAYAVFIRRRPPAAADNPGYSAAEQPLRNGDSGNVALYLLGLPAVPDSVIRDAGLTLESQTP